MVRLLFDLLRCCSYVRDICQIAWEKLHTFIRVTGGDSLAVPPFLESGVEFAFVSCQEINFCDSMKQELCSDL